MFAVTCRFALRQATSYPLRVIPRSIRRGALSHLLSTLALLEQREGTLQHGSLSAVTAAQKLGGSISGFIAGSGVKSVAEEAAKVQGIDKIILVENGAYDKVE